MEEDLFEFFPVLISFVALKNVGDIFGGVSSVPGACLCKTRSSPFHYLSGWKFLVRQYCRPYLLLIGRISGGSL